MFTPYLTEFQTQDGAQGENVERPDHCKMLLFIGKWFSMLKFPP